MSKLTRYKRRDRQNIKYSFLTGLACDDAQKWTLDDIRIPAEGTKHALRLYRVFLQSKIRYVNVTYNFKEAPNTVRMIVEYEKVRENGFTNWQFKHIKNYLVF